jgi:flagellar basal-body rod protein FlgB
MQLFDLASRHRAWLGDRQSVVAQNIANANTPGYKARAMPEFERALGSAGLAPSATHQMHLAGSGRSAVHTTEAAEPRSVTHSGNSVDVESELVTAGEVNRGYALNVSVVKTFRRMMTAAVKS